MVTGTTPISSLPTGTIDNLQAVFPLSIGMPSSPETIRASLGQLADMIGGLGIGGRITLVSGSPMMTSTVTGSSTIFWTPYNGQSVPLYDGSNMVMTNTGGQLSQLTTDTTKSPAATVPNNNYDLFIWNDAGTIRLSRGLLWASDTSRGAGTGTAEIEKIQGIWVNKYAITNGAAARRGTLVGSIRTNSAGTVNFIYGAGIVGGQAGVIGLSNAFNRVPISMEVHDTTTVWGWSTSTVQPMNPSGTNGGLNNRISYLTCLPEETVLMSMYMRGRTAAVNGANFSYGIGKDSVSALSATSTVLTLSATAVEGAHSCFTTAVGQLGFHFAQMLHLGDNTNASLAFGGLNQNGLIISTRY